jgi:hypothetical protein
MRLFGERVFTEESKITKLGHRDKHIHREDQVKTHIWECLVCSKGA